MVYEKSGFMSESGKQLEKINSSPRYPKSIKSQQNNKLPQSMFSDNIIVIQDKSK